MPKIFEIFGYHVDDRSAEAAQCRKAAACPFMGSDCDGGGNRYLSHVNLNRNAALKRLFPDRTEVASGVCSIQLRDGERPWIVCPRRLLYLGKSSGGRQRHQGFAQTLFLKHGGFAKGTKVGVWPELKIKYKERIGGAERSFDYTFDYIVMPIGRCESSEAAKVTGRSWSVLRRDRPKTNNAIMR